eukprot:1971990-Prymnesium_polylepis.1
MSARKLAAAIMLDLFGGVVVGKAADRNQEVRPDDQTTGGKSRVIATPRMEGGHNNINRDTIGACGLWCNYELVLDLAVRGDRRAGRIRPRS